MEVWELREGFGLEHLRKAKRPDPAPGPGEVLLMMRAASLNYRDTLVVRGGYGPRYTLPLIPVSDGVGEVVAVGEGIARVRVGDRVCPIFFQSWLSGRPAPEKFQRALGGDVDGVLARLMCVPADAVVRVPEHLTDEEAAGLPCAGITAWSASSSRPRGETAVRGGSWYAAHVARQAETRALSQPYREDAHLRDELQTFFLIFASRQQSKTATMSFPSKLAFARMVLGTAGRFAGLTSQSIFKRSCRVRLREIGYSLGYVEVQPQLKTASFNEILDHAPKIQLMNVNQDDWQVTVRVGCDQRIHRWSQTG